MLEHLYICTSVLQVSGASGMSAIACGAFHNMALSREGRVFTWGTNDYGQLGNGEEMHPQLGGKKLSLGEWA